MLSLTAPSNWHTPFRWGACALVLAWLLVTPAAAQLADAPWPKFSGDLQNTGQSSFGGAGQSWQQGQIGSAQTGAAIAEDGSIYVGAGPFESATLYALDPTGGAVEWSFGTDGPMGTSPAIGSDGTIYLSGIVDPPDIVAAFPPRLGLYAITPDGTQEWFFASPFTFSNGFFDVVQTAPAIAADGTIYVGFGGAEVDSLYAINPDGTRKWAAGIGGGGLLSPSIAPDGTIYIGADNGTLHAFDSDGTRKWEQKVGDFDVTAPAIGRDGTVYIGVDDGLVAVNPDGTEQWTFPIQSFSVTAPAVGADGTIYLGTGSEGGNAFYGVNPDGTEAWTVETSGPVFTAPAIGTNGSVYFGVYNSESSELVVLRPDGTEQWRFGPVDSPREPVTLAADGTIYLASNGGLASVVGPRIGLPPEPVDFSQIEAGGATQRHVNIENTGDADLTFAGASISGADAEAFSVVDGEGPVTIAPSQQHAVTVEFSSTTGGVREAQLTVSGNTASASVGLRGRILSLDPDPLPTPLVGEPVDFTIALPEDFEPQTSLLSYRISGTASYEQVELSSAGDGTALTGSIPASAVTVRGIDFYVRTSGEEFTLAFPAENPVDDPARLPVRFDQLTPAGSFEADTYRMISVPAVIDEGNLSAVFGDYGAYQPERWRVVQWDPQEETYKDLPDLQDIPAAPGQAFWLITREGEPFTLPAGRSTDASSPHEVALQPGWNQVGHPFAFPVSLSTIDLPEGVEGPVGFDGEAYQRNVQRLQPWAGYFFYNPASSPVTMSIPPVEASIAVESPTATASPAARDATEATMRLSARLVDRGLRDTKNVVGLAAGAEAGRDGMDYAEAPPVGDHVRLSIMESGERLAGSFKPPGGEGQWWDLEVTASVDEPFPSRKRVEVRLQTQGQPPEEYKRYLIDRDVGEALSLEQGATTLMLSGKHPTRRLRLIWGSEEFAKIHAEGAPVESYVNALHPNDPNPFRQATTIRYELRKSGHVVVAIYNMLGQRVRTLVHAEQKAGTHVAQWDGRNEQGVPVSSGVYFCRMRVGSFEATRKLTRVR